MTNSVPALMLLAGIAVSGLGLSHPALGAAIPVISGDDNETCIQGPALDEGAPCAVHIIERLDPAWQPANPLGQGAKWISYADTGPTGDTLAPPRLSAANPHGSTAIAIFSEVLPAADETS